MLKLGSASALATGRIMSMVPATGTVELITFGSRDIGMAGVTVTVCGFTAIIESADLASFINSEVSLETAVPGGAVGEGR
jgi:hypothetical protein